MADLLIVSLILLPILMVILLSMCNSCWKRRNLMSFYTFNKNYYLKNVDVMELSNHKDEKGKFLNATMKELDDSADINLLESADNSKQFEHAVLEIIDTSQIKDDCREEDVLSCSSNETSDSYRSIRTDRKVSAVSTITVYLDVK